MIVKNNWPCTIVLVLIWLLVISEGHGHHSHRHHRHKGRHHEHHMTKHDKWNSFSVVEPMVQFSTKERVYKSKNGDKFYRSESQDFDIFNDFKNYENSQIASYYNASAKSNAPYNNSLLSVATYANVSSGLQTIAYETKIDVDNSGEPTKGHSKSKEPGEEKMPSSTDDLKNIGGHESESATQPHWTLKFQGLPSEIALNNTRVNVTAASGSNAFLPCKIGHLGDRQISWIRRRDWHVLTSGNTLYTHDRRFSVLHEPGAQEWVLHIKMVDLRDIGVYECQVSMGTGIISIFVDLNVVIQEAFIPGGGHYHVYKASPISLTCYIKNSPAAPQYILWHHKGKLLNFLRNRDDFVITDNLGDNGHKTETILDEIAATNVSLQDQIPPGEIFLSHLSVEMADESHAGNYTCSAPNTEPAFTLVFITEGDKTAAVQRISSSGAPSKYNIVISLPVLLFTTLMTIY